LLIIQAAVFVLDLPAGISIQLLHHSFLQPIIKLFAGHFSVAVSGEHIHKPKAWGSKSMIDGLAIVYYIADCLM
jgi:hypothetical protein